MRTIFSFGLEIDASFIRLCKSEFRDNIYAGSMLVVEDIAGLNPSQVSDLLREIVLKHGVNSLNLVVVIPRDEVLLKYLELPSSDDKELAGMAQLQMHKELPFPVEEAYCSYRVEEKYPEKNAARVLIAAVKKEGMNRHIALLKEGGVEPRAMIVSSQGLLQWLKKWGTEKKVPRLLIDLDRSSAELVIVNSAETIVFSRSIVFHAGDDAGVILTEIKQSIKFYEYKKFGPAIEEVLIAGSKDHAASLSGKMKEEYSIPVHTIDPAQNVAGADMKADVSCADIIGASLLREEHPCFDLLPAELIGRRKAVIRIKYLTLAAMILAAVLLVENCRLIHSSFRKERLLVSAENRLKEISALSGSLKAAHLKIRLAQAQNSQSKQSLDMLCTVYRLVPPETYLSLYAYDAGRGITLQGNAFDMAHIFALVTALNGSGYFNTAEIKYAHRRKVADRELIDFQVQCSLKESTPDEN